jgi:hypothetical protein
MPTWLRIVLIAAAVAVAGMQLLPRGHRRTNPIVAGEPEWDSPRTRELFFRACGDCHSNETRWPWYSYVAPVSWFVIHHVEEGRGALNVSRWSEAMADAAGEADDEIRRGSMPLVSYLRMHPDARLGADDKRALERGLEATFRASIDPSSMP